MNNKRATIVEEQKDEYEDDYECDEDTIQNMNIIAQFCGDKISLWMMWDYFTKTDDNEMIRILMNYEELDNLIYALLAYFVFILDGKTIASRASMNELINDFRLRVIASFDPEYNGYIDYGAFIILGEYIQKEYKKLTRLSADMTMKAHKNDAHHKSMNIEDSGNDCDYMVRCDYNNDDDDCYDTLIINGTEINNRK